MSGSIDEPHQAQPSRNTIPFVSIVGRPNVGKSTLFNRLVGRRLAITDAVPGVTRDPVEADTNLNGTALHLVDTGGYSAERGEIERLVRARTLSILDRTDVIVLLLDVTELTSEDHDIADVLRRYGARVLVAVNKVDNREREAMVAEFHSFGFEPVVGISATHDMNIDALRDAIVTKIGNETRSRAGIVTASSEGAGTEQDAETRADVPIRVAILGQPNTGKSTLANALTGSESSIVSAIPGTTRDVIRGSFSFQGQRFSLLDTAGIRRKSKVSEDIEYYSVTRALSAVEEADVVHLLVDAEKGLTDQDKKIAAQVVKHGRGIVIVLNKWDLLEKLPNQLEAVRDRIRFVFPVLAFAPILPISARERTGLDALVEETAIIYRELQHRVDTGKLNAHLAKWVDATPPPTFRRGRFKLRYITQVSSHPVSFVLFVNRTHGFPKSYVGYIQNRIRSDFGFSRVPLDIVLRE